MTNHHWVFSQSAVKAEFGLQNLQLQPQLLLQQQHAGSHIRHNLVHTHAATTTSTSSSRVSTQSPKAPNISHPKLQPLLCFKSEKVT